MSVIVNSNNIILTPLPSTPQPPNGSPEPNTLLWGE